ncbi:MAG: amidase [Dehalococcoidia bacterium]|nr:amidase [Dehalococcoidia bacterium]
MPTAAPPTSAPTPAPTVPAATAPRPPPATATPSPATATPPPPPLPPAGDRQSTINSFAFEASIEVRAGATVTWANQDIVGHDVAAADGSFASTLLARGDSFGHRFAQPGSYPYLCTVHPFMTGTVTVR